MNIQLSYPITLIDRLTALFAKPKANIQVISSSSLNDISYRLMVKAMTAPANSSALHFLPIMERTANFGPEEWAFLADEPEGKKILVDNEFLKVLLIKWAPGSSSNIHGHPLGGGVIKVLEGSIEELRYQDAKGKVLHSKSVYSKQGTGYIDDNMAMHAVGNPFEAPAVTLHAYMKYR